MNFNVKKLAEHINLSLQPRWATSRLSKVQRRCQQSHVGVAVEAEAVAASMAPGLARGVPATAASQAAGLEVTMLPRVDRWNEEQSIFFFFCQNNCLFNWVRARLLNRLSRRLPIGTCVSLGSIYWTSITQNTEKRNLLGRTKNHGLIYLFHLELIKTYLLFVIFNTYIANGNSSVIPMLNSIIICNIIV